MNNGQSQILSFLQTLVQNANSAQLYADQNMSALFSSHSAPHLQSDCQALLDALANSIPFQAALAKLAQDIVLLPEIAQIV